MKGLFSNLKNWHTALFGVMLMMVGCGPHDGNTEDDVTDIGSVRPEQVVVRNDRWRSFLSNVTGYTFVLNDAHMVDTIYYDHGFATFTYRDEYLDALGASTDMVEMKLCNIDGTAHTMCSFNIGRNGYAKNATETYLGTGKSCIWRFSYDKHGYLTSLEAGSDMCRFKYVDGNLMEYTNYVDENEDLYFTYSSMSSHGYMPYFHAPGFIEGDFGPILPMAYLAGLAGKPSNNLPMICDRESFLGDYAYSYEYKYIFNNEGALVSLYFMGL